MTSTALPDTADFAPFLPGLYRYGRLLMGRQLLADGLVMDAIERTAAETAAQGGNDDQRLHLYREVTRSWRAAVADRIGGCRTSFAFAADADDDLRSVNSLARAAFLLVTVERFSNVAAARILDTTCGALQALLAEASIAVSKQAPTEVLIIEDELLIAFELEDIMTRLGHIVTSVVRSHRLAIKQAKVRRPQLILADINLADGSSGIDAVTEIIGDDSVPVVFITAYPERLLTGRRAEPSFLVAKPFTLTDIEAVVGQAICHHLANRSNAPFESVVAKLTASGPAIYS